MSHAAAITDQSRLNSRSAVESVFGKPDSTPWEPLWLAVGWAAIECIPGVQFLLFDLSQSAPTGGVIVGAFLLASLVAASSLWVWWILLGSVSTVRRWQVLCTLCFALIAIRFLASTQIQSLVALLIWILIGLAVVVLTIKYAAGYCLSDQQQSTRGELTIWLMLRYTLTAAIVAWYTKSLTGDDSTFLTPLAIVCIGLPSGLLLGAISFAVLLMMASRWWWVWLPICVLITLPISAAAAFYALQSWQAVQIVIAAIAVAIFSFVIHLFFFAIPLAAQRYAFTRIG